MDAQVQGRHSHRTVGPGMNSLRFRAAGPDKSSGELSWNQIPRPVVNQLKHDLRHVPPEAVTMSIPIPAETPDPNIDSPTIPPTEPEPVPEKDPPGTTPPPREEPPSTMPPVIVAPES